MKNTAIQWTHHTLNFWWGCTKVSPACTHCYAAKFAAYAGKRIFGRPVTWGPGQPRAERLQAARLEALTLERQAAKAARQDPAQRTLVFVNSMSDWLDDEVPLEWLAYLLETIHLCPHLTFQLLTKRPENWGVRVLAACTHMAGFRNGQTVAAEMQGEQMAWDWGKERKPPHNIWIGTTLETQAYDVRIERLLKIPARVRFLSCEPLLGPLDFTGLQCFRRILGTTYLTGLDWVIAGGESGAGLKSRPVHPDWLRSLRQQCAEAHIPFFFKQWGDWLPAGPESAHLSEKRRFRSQLLPATPNSPPLRMLHVGAKLAGNHLDGFQHLHMPPVPTLTD